MIRVVVLGFVIIVVMLLIWVAWGELEAWRAGRERERNERLGG